MATITLHGNAIHTSGNLPGVGSTAPDFVLTKGDLSDASLKDFAGKKKILNIVPSLDTSVCALSAKRFDAEVKNLSNVVVLNVSADLPFAQSRFCKEADAVNIVPLSELRNRNFSRDYGVGIVDGPMAGLMSRAVVVLDAENKVVYTEQVPEIGKEPDYQKALAAVK
jgi:thioredoxin-dependent peroxiredoxin